MLIKRDLAFNCTLFSIEQDNNKNEGIQKQLKHIITTPFLWNNNS